MSTTDQPAPKRKRTDGGDGETQLTTNPLRSEIWFEDGNVVLQATGTQFKVHRGILSQSSPVFKAMFLLPQPPSFDGDMIEGCPIVHLSDSAEVEYALGALFQRKCVRQDILIEQILMPFLRGLGMFLQENNFP